MNIVLIAKPGFTETGVGRYVQKLEPALVSKGIQVSIVYPLVPLPKFVIRWLKRWPGIDMEAFFNNYPVWACYPSADIYHITSQNLATLLLFHPPPGKSVVTVHDLIPWLFAADPELNIYRHTFEKFFDRLAILGLRRANGWIADSESTVQTLAMIGVYAKKVNLGI